MLRLHRIILYWLPWAKKYSLYFANWVPLPYSSAYLIARTGLCLRHIFNFFCPAHVYHFLCQKGAVSEEIHSPRIALPLLFAALLVSCWLLSVFFRRSSFVLCYHHYHPNHSDVRPRPPVLLVVMLPLPRSFLGFQGGTAINRARRPDSTSQKIRQKKSKVIE